MVFVKKFELGQLKDCPALDSRNLNTEILIIIAVV